MRSAPGAPEGPGESGGIGSRDRSDGSGGVGGVGGVGGAAGSGPGPAGEAIRLRPATAGDVPSIAAIEAASFSDPWPARAFYGLLRQDAARVTVAEAAGAVLGYRVVFRAADEAELSNVAVAAAARRRGVGGRLVASLLDELQADGVAAVYLEVRASNVAAQALYAAHGFEAVGRRRAYYRDPEEDALVLRRRLAMPPARR